MTATGKPNQVEAFVAACKAHGFSWEVASMNVLRIKCDVRDADAFARADCFAGRVLGLAPLRGGSVWGTDGGSVGGAVALQTGRFVMNKSGEGKRFMRALLAAV